MSIQREHLHTVSIKHDHGQRPFDFEILGWKFSWPANLIQLTAGMSLLFCVFGTIVGLAYLFLHAPTANLHALSNALGVRGYVATAGGKLEPQDTYQMGFWTPSAATVTTWQPRDAGGRPIDIRPWQELQSDDRVVEFGAYLRKQFGPVRLNGYRRYAVAGHGRSNYKEGYWWVVSLSDNVDPDELIRVYREFWLKRQDGSYFDDKIYVEVSAAGVDYLPALDQRDHGLINRR